jgi:hypothetical protein
MITENSNVNEDISALKSQVFTLLVALIVVSGTLTVFLYREASMAGKEITQMKAVSADLTKRETAIGTFVGQLVNYGEKHPDFVPVLKKYGLAPAPGMPGMPAAAPKK